ncbi:beta-ketoacyl-[acyl-carrier-protein] synthase family protein [Streptomyces pilosus]|uniref:Actinorhodin polyketide putative beta-ketoacyl synthase 1 n=2 Tax=Streptomyces pilosus TaxID=28893 RepID=A0A918C5N5_9ACTN|nr:beta-ketoacyl-[acyl-carrier-protein] synthase family protein [Streptomyces pilosus]GGR06458.1 actinorhodin polyketide putative beta-ketoacyl synthase 1 [Streptomyces pilosus]GGV68987.1 actinorhodin polyketide putative beta-ketoacyl synthase 1 [Streptomyces pilosus]
MERRIVITGIGAVAPGKPGAKEYWELISNGRTATRTISSFDPAPYRSRVAAECDFDPFTAGLGRQEVRRMDRATQFAVAAAREAVADSGLDLPADDPATVGVSLGNAVGCTTSMEREYAVLSNEGADWLVDHRYAVPHLYDHFVPSSIAAELARLVGAQGPVALVSDGCTSGLDAIGHGADLIREGSVDVVISGGTDAPISPITLACFDAIKATTPRNDDPEHASRPFDATRNGLVLGEGAAVLVLEELEHARRRGAQIYAEVAGVGTRCNAYHMTGLRSDGTEMADAITQALTEARLTPESVDYVNAHGSSTKQNDRHETAAFKTALGRHAYDVPISSVKSMIGHSLGAIGALELVACVLAMREGLVPPTANLHEPDPVCDLDYVPLRAREARVDNVLSVGSGFGGFQTAVVLARPEREAA